MHGSRTLYGQPLPRPGLNEEVESEDDALKTPNVHYSGTTDIGGGSRMVLYVSRELSRLGHEFTVLLMNTGKLAGDEVVDGRDIHRVNSSTYNLAHVLFSSEFITCTVGELGHH